MNLFFPNYWLENVYQILVIDFLQLFEVYVIFYQWHIMYTMRESTQITSNMSLATCIILLMLNYILSITATK